MSRDPLPGEIRPPGAEPPGEGGEAGDEGDRGVQRPGEEGGERQTSGNAEGFEPLRAHGKDGETPRAGAGSIPEDEGGPIGIFPSWAWVYGTVIAWATFLILLLWFFTITFDFGAR